MAFAFAVEEGLESGEMAEAVGSVWAVRGPDGRWAVVTTRGLQWRDRPVIWQESFVPNRIAEDVVGCEVVCLALVPAPLGGSPD